MGITQTNKVFLSYADADRKWAELIADGLMQRGFAVWYDARQVLPGDNLAAMVSRALEESGWMVVLISPHSLKSRAVRSEIDYALGTLRYAHRLIPVIIKNSADMPWVFRQLALIEATTASDTIERIAAALKGSNLARKGVPVVKPQAA